MQYVTLTTSKAIALIALIALMGCANPNTPLGIATANPKAKGPCYAPSNGIWRPVDYNVAGNNNTLTLTDQCTGGTTYCGEIFTYQPQQDGITAIVIVTTTNGGPECLSLGAHSCTVQMIAGQNNNQVTVNCGVGKNDSDNYNRLQ